MQKTKRLLFALVLLLNCWVLKSQIGICTNPRLINLNDICSPIDTTSTNPFYYKFTASNKYYAIKVYIQNLTISAFHSVAIYSDNCSNLGGSLVTSTSFMNGDTITVYPDSFLIGSDYLIEITDNSANRTLLNYYSVCMRALTPGSVANIGPCPIPATPCDLVCNGGFENGVFPTSHSQINNAGGWGSANVATPDYFAVGSPSVANNVPCNIFGFQNPNGGNRYAGIVAGSINLTPGYNYAEYVETQFTSPMVANTVYEIEFFASRGDFARYDNTNVGIYITPNIIADPTSMHLIQAPTILYNNLADLNDATNWRRISLCYRAVGGERFLTIGESVAINTPSVITPAVVSGCAVPSPTLHSNAPLSCLFIDDVSVRPFTPTITAVVNPCTSVATFSTSSCTNSLTASYNWNFGDGNTVTNAGPTPTHFYLPGIYTTTLSVVFNCATVTAVTTLTVPPPATMALSATQNTICSGNSTTLSQTGLTSFTWQPGGQTVSPVVVSPPFTTTYTVSGTNAIGCPLSSTITIFVNPTPTINIIPSANPICFGSSVTMTLTGANTYTTQLGNLIGSVINVTPTTTTTYTTSGTNNFGCVGSSVITITVNPLPLLTLTASSNSICTGSSSTLTASGANTYTWQPSSLTGSLVVVSPTVSTIYTVTGTSIAGCTSTNTIAITVFPLPTITVVKSANTICQGSSVTMTMSGASTYTTNPGNLIGTPITVSPSVTTIYTITGTSSSGCTNTITTGVTVISNTISVSSSTNQICQGVGSVTLSSGAMTSYTWQPGGANTQNIVVTPSVTTTYTIFGTFSALNCLKTATITVTVNPTPVLAITGPSVICTGSSATLTASGATTYSWNTGPTTSSIVVSPTVATTYTVTGTSAFGCVATTTTNVQLSSPPTIFATASPSNVCLGNTTTLTATGTAPSFTWLPSNTTGSVLIVSPTISFVYTVQHLDPVCGMQTATVQVNVVSTPTSASISSTTGSPYICLGNSTTLTLGLLNAGNYSYSWTPGGFTTPNIVITPTDNAVYSVIATETVGCGGVVSASLCVDVTSTMCCTPPTITWPTSFNITGASPFVAMTSQTVDVFGTVTVNANTTWQNCIFRFHNGAKLVVRPNRSLTMNLCHLFSCEDMWEGITVMRNGASGGTVIANGCFIEDAYKGIQHNALNKNFRANIQTGQTTFNKNYIGIEVTNVRNVVSGQTTFVVYDWFQSRPSANSPGNNLKCSNFYAPTIVPRGIRGINLDNVNYGLVVGDLAFKWMPPNPYRNFFENLDNGIYMNESGLDVYNAEFKAMSSKRSGSYYANVGVAIYAIASLTTASTHSLTLHVENGSFIDVWKGIATYGMNETQTLYSFFNAATTSTFCTSGCIASTGILYNDAKAITRASFNQIDNYAAGILQNFSFVSATPTFSFGIGNNTITASGVGACDIGISVTDAANNFSVPTAYLPIAANTIANTASGISVLNVKNGLRISNNTINLIYNPSITPQRGIFSQGCNLAIIDNNTIDCGGTGNVLARGIHMQLSPQCQVACNNIIQAGQSLVYEGNNISSTNGFYNNQFGTAIDGFVTEFNGQAGQQGSPSVASGNLWNGTYSNSRTFTDCFTGAASSALNTFLWVNAGPLTNPATLGPNLTTGVNFLDNYGSANTVSVTTGSALPCPAALTTARIGTLTSVPVSTAAVDVDYNRIINAATNYTVLNNETHTIHNKHAYNAMRKGSITTSDPTLLNFYNVNKTTSLEQFEVVDSLVENSNLSNAVTANASSTPTCAIEQNQKDLNDLLIKHLSDNLYPFSTAELSQIWNIAKKCPLKDGNAVYQARSLVRILEARYIDFIDSCGTGEGGQGERTFVPSPVTSIVSQEPNNSFLLYPNPNNGNMNLLYNLSTEENASVTVVDLTGKVVYKSDIIRTNNRLEINMNEFKEGIYLYKVESGNKVLKTDKLVIIK